jgi:hypothetical protein
MIKKVYSELGQYLKKNEITNIKGVLEIYHCQGKNKNIETCIPLEN